MDNETRKALIPELDSIIRQAEEVNKEFGYVIERHRLYGDPTILPASQAAYAFIRETRKASDALKQSPQGIAYIQGVMTVWYHFHVELDVEKPANPDFESVTYKGNNEWEIIMTTPTDGREKAVVHSDAASWDQVYSVDPA